MSEIPAAVVKQLREKTGAGFMDCKKALVDAAGDLAEAELLLRKRGVMLAQKKASRETREGLVGSYIHPGGRLGVLVEVNCESDFVARTDDFRDLVRDLSMQIAASDPRWIRREDVAEDALEREKQIQRARALEEGKPEKILDKIVEGRLTKFFEEICLLEQPFVKDNSITVAQLVASRIAKLGENITVSRFVRFKVGERDG